MFQLSPDVEQDVEFKEERQEEKEERAKRPRADLSALANISMMIGKLQSFWSPVILMFYILKNPQGSYFPPWPFSAFSWRHWTCWTLSSDLQQLPGLLRRDPLVFRDPSVAMATDATRDAGKETDQVSFCLIKFDLVKIVTRNPPPPRQSTCQQRSQVIRSKEQRNFDIWRFKGQRVLILSASASPSTLTFNNTQQLRK